jgi:thymidylate kinase
VKSRRLVVSFSGLDGAGKTRQVDALVEELGGPEHAEVLWVPFRIWPEPLLSKLPASLRSRIGPNRRSRPPSRAGGPPRPHRTASLVSASRRGIWALIAFIAAVSAGLSLRRRVAVSKSEVLLLDRYRIDSIVKLLYWYPEVSRSLLAGVVRTLAPAPDVEIYLRLDPDTAYLRKPEQWTRAQLARQAQLYDQIMERFPSALVLDAREDPQVLARAVRDAVGEAR